MQEGLDRQIYDEHRRTVVVPAVEKSPAVNVECSLTRSVAFAVVTDKRPAGVVPLWFRHPSVVYDAMLVLVVSAH